MANGKVTLAELRREAERVGAGSVMVFHAKREFTLRWHACAGTIDICGDDEWSVRSKLRMILRALPDGALKEG